jgi:hypothetical protein
VLERESWPKNLRCPLCGLEGVARLSHVDDAPGQDETRTIVYECPNGFKFREDEDDSNIFRFFCVTHDVSADQ